MEMDMKLSLNTTSQLFPPTLAEAKASELKLGDPDWDYKVSHDPKGTGYSFIEIYDENGEFVAKF